jgi:hypothetical protein
MSDAIALNIRVDLAAIAGRIQRGAARVHQMLAIGLQR